MRDAASVVASPSSLSVRVAKSEYALCFRPLALPGAPAGGAVGGAQPQRTQHKPSRAAEPEGSSSQGMARVPSLDARMDREVAVETSPRRKSRRVAAIPFDRLLLLAPPHPPILSMRFTRRCRDNDADVVAQPVGGLWMQHGRPGR